MIVNDRLTSYLHSLDSRESEIIEAIGREARADRVPIIRQETGSLLKVLLKMNKPQRILEIGTAVAYSAILMSECLEPGYDFIFMDAAKGQYIHFLPEVLRLLKKGGLLVSDNVLQDGDIIESRFAVTRRNRTIYSRMRDYLWQLKHMKEFETAVLTVGDGVTISTKLTE